VSICVYGVALERTARAQTNGTIRGTVVDQSGAVVPGTVITVVLGGTDTRRSVTADKDGSFDIPELTVGSYELSADAKGFKKYVEKDVLVTIGHVKSGYREPRGWRICRYRHRGGERCASGDHQHPARRRDDRHCHTRTPDGHAQRILSAPVAAWSAIAGGRGLVFGQR